MVGMMSWFFFDFSGLPQIGLDEKGEQIPRTAEEAANFFEALPLMGAFYTMYPVLVLRQITPGVAPYHLSGWCFSEFASAMLTGQLEAYSKPAMEELKSNEQYTCIKIITELAGITIGQEKEEEVMRLFDADLSTKKFFNEDDRPVVRSIIEGYLFVRQLTDAVRQGSADDTDRLLVRCQQKGLLSVLTQPVGDSLDTLLHIAVKAGNVEVAKLLLKAGSSCDVKNGAGDRPDQWRMLPRCNEAAATCRKVLSGVQGQGYENLNANADADAAAEPLNANADAGAAA